MCPGSIISGLRDLKHNNAQADVQCADAGEVVRSTYTTQCRNVYIVSVFLILDVQDSLHVLQYV